MTSSQFKQIGRILKQVYAQLEADAIKRGINLMSAEYRALQDKARLAVLNKSGFTLEEYGRAKAEVVGFTQADMLDVAQETKAFATTAFNKIHIPTKEEITQIALEVAKQFIVPPQITNQIVKETIIEKPIKETINTVNKVEYNDAPLLAELGYIADKVDNIKIPEPVDVGKLKEEIRNEFAENFEKNIDTLGMPDFRKLAMGLQQQIDENKASAGSNYTLPTASAATKGGIKIGSRLTMTGDTLSADVQAGGAGDVVGPASAVDSNFAAFDTTTGKLIKDSGHKHSDYAAALGADDNYVTDAEKIVIGNTSGTNTGDASGHAALAPLASPTFTGTVTLPVGLTGVIRADVGVVSVDSNVTDLVSAASTSTAGLAPQATAPAAGLYNYVGITNGETAYTNKALFNATAPSTQAFGDAAAVGTATEAARQDHKHAMMAAPTSVSGNAGTVTNATLTTALTIDTGTVKIHGNNANTSELTLGAGAITINGTATKVYTLPSVDASLAPLTSPAFTTPNLGTPSAGTLTSCTGLPIAGLTASTSTALGVGSLEVGHASDSTITRVSAGVLAIEGKNILTTDGGTLTGNITLGENTSIDLDPAGSADGKYSGICITGTAGATLAFGDLIYLAVATSKWVLTDADATATGGAVLVGMCVLAANDTQATKILLQGQIRADAKFPALTIGAVVYLGETAGAIQVAIPTGADNVIRVMGFALTADEIYFNPSQDHQITVA